MARYRRARGLGAPIAQHALRVDKAYKEAMSLFADAQAKARQGACQSALNVLIRAAIVRGKFIAHARSGGQPARGAFTKLVDAQTHAKVAYVRSCGRLS